jgi:lipoprotein NlpI
VNPLRRSLAIAVVVCGAVNAQSAQELFNQAVKDFHAGRIKESVAGFDQVVKLAPGAAPQLWQRGIAQYYAGFYKACREQFELHRTVNPNDVENAAWHFLCVARAENPDKARRALLPVGPDPRTPMREIYRMFRGDATPEQVLAAGSKDAESQFYAQLYVGLYLEAAGKQDRALEHIRIAADERYAAGGYMNSVARVHLRARSSQR